MRLSVIQKLWREKYPTGDISRLSNRRFNVTYHREGKGYTYTADNVVKLGERLGLVESLDIEAIARDAVSVLTCGGDVKAPVACADSIRYHYQRSERRKAHTIIMTEDAGFDQWERPMYLYFVAAKESDPWRA